MKYINVGFIAAMPSLQSINEINKLIINVNELLKNDYNTGRDIIPDEIKVKPLDLHCSLIVDRRNLSMPVEYMLRAKKNIYYAKAKKLELFNSCFVLELESEDLINRHEYLLKYGFTHSFPNYRPHITLTYNFDKTDDVYKYFINYDLKPYLKNMPELTLMNEKWEKFI